jgi:hypothetical protein
MFILREAYKINVSGINSPNRVHFSKKIKKKISPLVLLLFPLDTSSSWARMEAGLKEEDGVNGYILCHLCWRLLKSSASKNGAH